MPSFDHSGAGGNGWLLEENYILRRELEKKVSEVDELKRKLELLKDEAVNNKEIADLLDRMN